MARQPLALNEMIDNLFGIRSHLRETNPVSGTAGAAVQILPNDPKRVGVVICNLSTHVCFVGLSNQVAADNGIWLSANGGNITLVWDRDFELCSHELFCISAAGADQLYCMEYIAE